jgi:4-diphosphocytidyl-2-C-methyl-D-erythritol kinase
VKTITVSSPAKINLFLEVICKRSDAYHEVKTYMVPIDVRDEVTITRTAGRAIMVACDRPEVPAGKDNLVYRAAAGFFKSAGIPRRGLRISIVKRIPVAAGLGGGSGNAAAALRGLNKLYGNPLTRGELMRTAALLGADVPFFLHTGGALCVGRGDEVIPLPCPKAFWVVLAVPRVDRGTKSVKTHKTAGMYRSLNLGLTKDIRAINMLLYALECCDLDKIGRALFNRIEKVAFRKNSRLKHLCAAFIKGGASGALLSGSGPTVYAIVASRNDAGALRKKIEPKFGAEFSFFTAKVPAG